MAPQGWLVESWACFGIQILIIGLRVFVRTRTVGFFGWRGDDYLIILALGFMFMNSGLSQAMSIGTGIKVGPNTPEEELDKVRISMKYGFFIWVGYTSFIWCLKFCMLFFYHRLTIGLPQQKLVTIGFVLCGLTWIAVWLQLFLHCRPFWNNWQVWPDPGVHCATGHDNFIPVGTMNVFTDCILLCIPIPLLWRSKMMNLRRKLILGVLLCSGVFLIIATILRNVFGYIQSSNPGKLDKGFVIGWATRESFIATIVVNAPCIKPLFTSKAWFSSEANQNAAVVYEPPSGNSSLSCKLNFWRKASITRSLSAIDRSIMETYVEKGEGDGVIEVRELSGSASSSDINDMRQTGRDEFINEVSISPAPTIPARTVRASVERRIIDIRSIEEGTVEQWIQAQRDEQARYGRSWS